MELEDIRSEMNKGEGGEQTITRGMGSSSSSGEMRKDPNNGEDTIDETDDDQYEVDSANAIEEDDYADIKDIRNEINKEEDGKETSDVPREMENSASSDALGKETKTYTNNVDDTDTGGDESESVEIQDSLIEQEHVTDPGSKEEENGFCLPATVAIAPQTEDDQDDYDYIDDIVMDDEQLYDQVAPDMQVEADFEDDYLIPKEISDTSKKYCDAEIQTEGTLVRRHDFPLLIHSSLPFISFCYSSLSSSSFLILLSFFFLRLLLVNSSLSTEFGMALQNDNKLLVRYYYFFLLLFII